uniref:Uncharacterized protein n=1 Tax=Sphaerodactylus townsendi TaxID=933632 RepID=A0ACB8EV94_9SAUR
MPGFSPRRGDSWDTNRIESGVPLQWPHRTSFPITSKAADPEGPRRSGTPSRRGRLSLPQFGLSSGFPGAEPPPEKVEVAVRVGRGWDGGRQDRFQPPQESQRLPGNSWQRV